MGEKDSGTDNNGENVHTHTHTHVHTMVWWQTTLLISLLQHQLNPNQSTFVKILINFYFFKNKICNTFSLKLNQKINKYFQPSYST